MKELSVIIVNYNVKLYLYQCIRSVEAATSGLNADIWVVDNNSHDGSIEFLKPLFPEVNFICNTENVGFSRANNQAIRQSESKYVLLLNPDTIVTRQAIHDSVQWMNDHPEAGSVGVALHNAAGIFAKESRRGVPTPLVSFGKISGLIKLFPHHRTLGRYYMGNVDPSIPGKVEILSGAYMMLRREALNQIGLLDETFFMYGEDVDLSYRMLLGGWKNFYLPRPIIHYKGESEHPSTIRYVNVFHQAMIIFYAKHFSRRFPLSGLLIRIAVYCKAFMSLIKHAFCWLKDLVIPSQDQLTVYYCLSSEAQRANIMRLCEAEQSALVFIKKGQKVKATQNRCYLLIDTTAFSYDKAINELLRLYNPKFPLQLATYHPNTGILLP